MRGDQTGTNENVDEDFVHATYKLFVEDPTSSVDDKKEDLPIETITDEDQTVKCKIVVLFPIESKNILEDIVVFNTNDYVTKNVFTRY